MITVNGKDNLSADLGIYKPKYNLVTMYGKIQIKMVFKIKMKRYIWRNGNIKDENGNVLKQLQQTLMANINLLI